MLRLSISILFLWVLHSGAHDDTDTRVSTEENESVLTDDTPVDHVAISGGEVEAGEREWRKPDFSKQENHALGYKEEAFQVPKGLEKNVQFWTDVYTKYSTHQGIIHDSEYIDLIYEVVDFNAVEKMPDLTARAREKMKKKLVDSSKEKVSQILQKFDKNPNQDVTSFNPLEKKIWDHFQKIDNPKKFREANHKNRIRFQLGQSDRMKSAIFFSGRYMEDFEDIFRENGLPIELTRLIFVESSFNVLARSKVGASGLWQLMPSVARPHRMISPYVDRRNDPWDATKLAAKVLVSNYKLLADWPLAITGYNHGPNGMRRMITKYNKTSIVDMVENVRTKANFGFASRNFYATFLAALEVEKNASLYFPDVKWSGRLNMVAHKINTTLAFNELMNLFDQDKKCVEIYNPHLTSRVKGKHGLIPAGTKVYVPTEKLTTLLEKLGSDRRVAAEDPIQKKKNTEKN